jgi:hypothetical protein
MKTNHRRLVALALFILALNVATFAQDFTSKFRVNIPFSFYAGSKMLPAGDYIFSLNRETSNIAIRGDNQNAGAFLFGSPNDSLNNGLATLTFHTDGNGGYVLEKFQGPDFGLSFAARKGGAKAAGTMAKAQTNRDRLVVIDRLAE